MEGTDEKSEQTNEETKDKPKVNIKRQSVEFLEKFSTECDSMYREGLDGYIGLKQVPDEQTESGKSLQMITIVDMSLIWEEKEMVARELGTKYEKLNHPNLLNFVKPIHFEASQIKDGLMIFTTESPDHRNNWKTLCKAKFDLE